MAKMGDVDLSAFKEFKKKIDKIDLSKFLVDCNKGLAQKYLKSATMLTPVDTGNLKGEWRNSTPVITNSGCEVTITNSADYASYVEFGHRTRGGKGWVEGRYMMTKTEQKIEASAPKYIDHKLKQALRGLGE